MASGKSSKKLKIEVGATLMLEFHYTAKGESRSLQNITAHFAGVEHGKYVLVRLTDNIEKYHYVFTNLEGIIVKYILKGVAYVFQAELLDKSNTPAPLLYLAYPEDFESQSLRKIERVRFNPVASLKAGGRAAKGQVIDISHVGARVDLLTAVRNPGAAFPRNLELEISFSLPGQPGLITARARITWSRLIDSDWCLGLIFLDPPSSVTDPINKFITEVKNP